MMHLHHAVRGENLARRDTEGLICPDFGLGALVNPSLVLNIKVDGVFDDFDEAKSLAAVEEDLGLSAYLSCVEVDSRYFLRRAFCSENLHTGLCYLQGFFVPGQTLVDL